MASNLPEECRPVRNAGAIPEGKEIRKQVNVKYLKIFDYEYQTISRQSSG